MSNFIKDYFSFSNRERKGFIVLVIAIFLSIILPKIYLKYKVHKAYDYSEFEVKIDLFLANQEKLEAEDTIRSYFDFDPNTATIIEFKQLGLSDYQIKNLVNYRNAGGSFKEPNDIAKIYSLDKDLVAQLLPYVKIVKVKKPKHSYIRKKDISPLPEKKKNFYKPELNIEINTADSVQLITIKGIGPVFASRIINYRNSLGGFNSMNQLNEVFGLKPEIIEEISKICVIDTSQIKKVDLNLSEFNQLVHHPYLNYKQTKAIFQYRSIMGDIKSPACLIQNHLVDSVTYYKILPYLVFNKND